MVLRIDGDAGDKSVGKKSLRRASKEDKVEKLLRETFKIDAANIGTFDVKGNDEVAEPVLESKTPIPTPQPPKEPEDTSPKHKTHLSGMFDGAKSYDEIINKINQTNDLGSLLDIAAKLMVSVDDSEVVGYSNGDSTINGKKPIRVGYVQYNNNPDAIGVLKNKIIKAVNLLKEADKNQDMSISDNELTKFDSNYHPDFRDGAGSRKATTQVLGMLLAKELQKAKTPEEAEAIKNKFFEENKQYLQSGEQIPTTTTQEVHAKRAHKAVWP